MSLLPKSASIMTLALLLLFPLGQIEDLASGRQQLKFQVLNDIAETASGAQQVLGPVLVVPYVVTTHDEITDAKTDKVQRVERKTSGQLFFIPEHLSLTAQATTESRQRGIYSAELYRIRQQWQGDFKLPANWGLSSTAGYQFEPAFLMLGVSDPRGLSQPELHWQGETLSWLPGTRLEGWKHGMHALLPALTPGQPLDFQIALSLQGTQSFGVIPSGRETSVSLSADWPHPHFGGQFLPTRHQVSDQGFKADWQTSVFATQIDSLLELCLTQGQCELPAFNVDWFEGINVYQLTDRTLKYAFLFIGLTFAGLLLYEMTSQIRLHPVQYSLAGLALALFFLLLLALSEHLRFWLAYLIAAGACIGLVSYYLALVLKTVKAFWAMGSLLTLLYALLYVLLSSEDQALLLGSLLLFVCLGGIMLVTGRIDWYQLADSDDSSTPSTDRWWRKRPSLNAAD